MRKQTNAQDEAVRPQRSYRAQVVLAFIPVVLLHIAGFGLFFFMVEPLHLQLGSSVFGVGIAVVAYVLGVRHAFDADHIAAIDNTTRKLVDLRRPAAGVGLFFSLGHSTIVFLMAALLALGVSWAVGLSDDGNEVRNGLGVFGTVVSGVFLLLIGLINAVAFMGILKVWRASRNGEMDEVELERHLQGRGFITRILRPLMRTIDRPGKMYAVGFLFGLGFDTASEIALLVLAGTGAATGLPWYAILCLPLIFAAGMSLFDTLDSSVMVRAYGWASVNAVRKVYYNLTITGLSVMIAVMIGGIELVGLLNEKLGLRDPLTVWIAGIDLENVGYIIVGLLVLVWIISTAYWRFGRVEEKWALPNGGGSPGTAAPEGPAPGQRSETHRPPDNAAGEEP
ncbi:HoxN/HupN/NixA family nickel/cobalt transporter [Arthrobacter sp. 3Tela_A]|uniref:HoxN/HupN/NixA family nickel/cobalt transporter n=1 Tax=Arthrobacter sp. 3Tela_A TaxID=3093743 RepID=UPI003BB4D62F